MQIEPRDKETFKVVGDIVPHHKILEKMGCRYDIYQCCYVAEMSMLREVNAFINGKRGPRRELPVESFQGVRIRSPVFPPGTTLKIGDEIVGTLLDNEVDEFGVIHRMRIFTDRRIIHLVLGYQGWLLGGRPYIVAAR